MLAALATLLLGTVAGYLAQRSRLCFVGGLRDFLLIRETALLKGAGAFFLAAWVAFPLASLAGLPVWELQAPATVAAAVPVAAAAASSDPPALLLSFPLIAAGAGLVMGFASVISNGCPLRMHVMAAQGSRDAWWYLGGLYAGGMLWSLASLL